MSDQPIKEIAARVEVPTCQAFVMTPAMEACVIMPNNTAEINHPMISFADAAAYNQKIDKMLPYDEIPEEELNDDSYLYVMQNGRPKKVKAKLVASGDGSSVIPMGVTEPEGIEEGECWLEILSQVGGDN